LITLLSELPVLPVLPVLPGSTVTVLDTPHRVRWFPVIIMHH
jgi:hypothetical protein